MHMLLVDYWIEKGAIGLNGVIGCFGMTGTSLHPSSSSPSCVPVKFQRKWSFLTDLTLSFDLVELAHGSNVAGLETTATLDERTDEFVVYTPHLGATKWWDRR
jgi:acyl-CoA oxidase